METEPIPLYPLNGRVAIKLLPFKPSKLIEVISNDRADGTEAEVVAVGPFRHGRKKTRTGWQITADTFPHEVSVGERVVVKPVYQDDDYIKLQGVEYRVIDPWEIVAKINKPRTDGYENPLTGEKTPEHHILFSK